MVKPLSEVRYPAMFLVQVPGYYSEEASDLIAHEVIWPHVALNTSFDFPRVKTDTQCRGRLQVDTPQVT